VVGDGKTNLRSYEETIYHSFGNGAFSRKGIDDGPLRTGGRGGGCGLGGPVVAYDAVIEKLYKQ